MSSKLPEEHPRLVPPEELRCVWMTAGILSYQLCEHQFDCENCPLDQAMRAHFRRGEPAPSERDVVAVAAGPTPGALRKDRLYTRSHCWVKRFDQPIGDDMQIRVGLEPGLAAALLTPRSVVRGETGAQVHQGDAHTWIVTEGGTFAVAAPVTGIVHHTNALLNDRPHVVASRPMDEGWLFEMRVKDTSTEFSTLLGAGAAQRSYDADADRFRAELHRAIESESATAPALADGGVLLRSISDMLGPTRYFTILRSVYG